MKLFRVREGEYKVGLTDWFIRKTFFDGRFAGWDYGKYETPYIDQPKRFCMQSAYPLPTLREAKLELKEWYF